MDRVADIGYTLAKKSRMRPMPRCQILRRGRIRDADVVLRAEAFAGNDHDMRLMQQPVSHVGCGLHAACARNNG